MLEPGDPAFQLTEANKPLVRQWLIAQGFDPARVDGMRDDTLGKAYRSRSYLNQMKTRADYYPACGKGEQPCAATMDTSPTVRLMEQTNGSAPPLSTTPTITGRAMAAADLSPPIYPTQLPALTPKQEARVIELIKEYAPRSIINLLQLGEF